MRSILNKKPKINTNCFIAENAVIIGDVRIGSNCSIWYNAVLRGDVNSITIGEGSNVQDGAILHCTYKKAALNIGKHVSIAHGAIVHGCTIEDEVLVGMGAIIMDECIVGSHCIVAAGAIVTQGMVLKSGFIYAGTPAKAIKKASRELIDGEIQRIANNYNKYASWYHE